VGRACFHKLSKSDLQWTNFGPKLGRSVAAPLQPAAVGFIDYSNINLNNTFYKLTNNSHIGKLWWWRRHWTTRQTMHVRSVQVVCATQTRRVDINNTPTDRMCLNANSRSRMCDSDHGRQNGGPWSPVFLNLQREKVCFLSFEGKKSNFTTFGPH